MDFGVAADLSDDAADFEVVASFGRALVCPPGRVRWDEQVRADDPDAVPGAVSILHVPVFAVRLGDKSEDGDRRIDVGRDGGVALDGGNGQGLACQIRHPQSQQQHGVEVFHAGNIGQGNGLLQ